MVQTIQEQQHKNEFYNFDIKHGLQSKARNNITANNN
jgi:hypothetical protein